MIKPLNTDLLSISFSENPPYHRLSKVPVYHVINESHTGLISYINDAFSGNANSPILPIVINECVYRGIISCKENKIGYCTTKNTPKNKDEFNSRYCLTESYCALIESQQKKWQKNDKKQ